MSRLLFSTALAGLLVSAGAAMAQPQDHRGPMRSAQAQQNRDFSVFSRDNEAIRAGRPPPSAAAQPPAASNNSNNFRGGRDDNGRRGDDRGGQAAPPAASNGGYNNFRSRDDDRGRDFRNNNGNDRRDFDNRNDRRDWNRGGGYRNNNNWSSYQRSFRSPQRYRGPSYVRPRGWYAQRWTYGQILPSLFWTSNYWINDYYYYGLQAPPPGTVWVRDGFDALLIDRYNGQIIQVVYDVYY